MTESENCEVYTTLVYRFDFDGNLLEQNRLDSDWTPLHQWEIPLEPAPAYLVGAMLLYGHDILPDTIALILKDEDKARLWEYIQLYDAAPVLATQLGSLLLKETYNPRADLTVRLLNMNASTEAKAVIKNLKKTHPDKTIREMLNSAF